MKKILTFLLISFIFMSAVQPVFSQGQWNPAAGGRSSNQAASGAGCTNATGTVCTALGDIPTDPTELVKWILKYAILIGGGIAFLLSMWGGITIILGAGNPEKINEGKETISSAVTGILFIIFSVFLLRLIGVDILGIPGFSR